MNVFISFEKELNETLSVFFYFCIFILEVEALENN